jgi:DNA-binding CsgD family transcriptional regulator
VNWNAIATTLADHDERPMVAVDDGGVVRLFNTAAERLLGWRRADVKGKRWRQLAARVGDLELRSVGAGLHVIAVSRRLAAPAKHGSALGKLVHERVATLSQEYRLSAREREVLAHLVRGDTVEDIGTALGITPRTAKFHQANVLAKLGIASRVELIRLLVDPDR